MKFLIPHLNIQIKNKYYALQGKFEYFTKSIIPLILLVLVSLFWTTASAQTKITGLSSDKAIYSPGSVVYLKATLNQSQTGTSLRVKYYQLNSLVNSVTVNFTGSTATWSWTTPSDDFKGYMVSVELLNGTNVLSSSSIGVNVSSNHSKFPIYGFLSKFPYMTDYQMDVQMDTLNRYHINYIQFYDWMDTHQDPLAGTATAPDTLWDDLARRPTYFNTVKGYIDRGHNNYNMKSMFYNLLYGSYSNTSFDPSWYLYRDQAHTSIWSHGLPSSWETPAINMMDLNNLNWRNYFLGKVNEVYTATNLHFDGWQLDQLGDWGYMYNSNGQQVDVAQTFPGFVTAAKNAQPTKSLVLNAVNTYGQSLLGNQPLDFFYTEMWDGNNQYKSFRDVIQTNEGYNAAKKNLFAAYVGKSRSGSAGMHSEAAVLLADATIFALGGAHIERGEHLLCNEYFPNNNLSMSSDLSGALVSYYDFLVGYQNILRDGRTFNNIVLSGANTQYWPPVQGKISTFGVSQGNNLVFHCLNYSNVNTLNWQDDQPVPQVINGTQMSFPCSTTISKLWVASPDFDNGLPQQISFSQINGTVTFTLPKLKYWTMVVAEQEVAATIPEGVYVIKARHSGKALDVVESSVQNGALIHQWDSYNLLSQQWNFVSVGDGYYKIENKKSGKVLDVAAGSLDDGAAIHQWQYYSGLSSQQWKLIDVGNGYYRIKNRNSGKSLDVYGASTNNGALVKQYTYTESLHQQWSLEFYNSSIASLAKATDRLEQSEESASFQVIPNPANRVIQIRCSAVPGKIEIINSAGATVYRGNINDRLQAIDVSSLPVGLYFVKIQTSPQHSAVQKLMINR